MSLCHRWGRRGLAREEKGSSACCYAAQLQGVPPTPQPAQMAALEVHNQSQCSWLALTAPSVGKKPQTHASSARSQTSVVPSPKDGETRTPAQSYNSGHWFHACLHILLDVLG